MAAEVSIEIRGHSTEDISFQFFAGNNAVNLEGIDHLEMEMRDSQRKVYSYSSNDSPSYLSIITASTGKVKFSVPSSDIFLASHSPYKGYWRVYETATKHYTVPEDSEFVIYVREEY